MEGDRLAVIGGGRMGSAIVGGLLAAGAHKPGDVTVADTDAARREALSAELGVRCVAYASEAVTGARTVLLAVKPQVIDDVVVGLSSDLAPEVLVVSIAAGVMCARLESLLPAQTAVVRVMPNTPALVGQGMAVISGGAAATPEQVEAVREMFASLGEAVVLDESLQDAATAISGSGPAYFAEFARELAEAGAAQGLPRDIALTLALRTMAGTAALLIESGMTPEELVAAVSSPGGTTVAAMAVLRDEGLHAAVSDAVAAAVKRAGELGGP